MVADHQGVRDQGGVNPSNKNKVAAWTLATERLVEQPLRVKRVVRVPRSVRPDNLRQLTWLACDLPLAGQFFVAAVYDNVLYPYAIPQSRVPPEQTYDERGVGNAQSMSKFPARLIDGYRGFLSGRLKKEQSRYRELAERGQSPEVMVIGCCDSRVSPVVIFDANPGELFVVRNVANLVPPYAPDDTYHGVSAALEFGVQALQVKHVVVLGHARCGGIRAYAEQRDPLSPSDFIGKWMSIIAPAAEVAAGMADWSDFATRLEHASIVSSLANLMTFPCISILVGRGKLQLHGAYFDVATGRLETRDPDSDRFNTVAAEEYAQVFAQVRF